MITAVRIILWESRDRKSKNCQLNNELILHPWDGWKPLLLEYIQTFDQEYNELIGARVVRFGPWIPSFDHFLEGIHVLHLDLWWIYERCPALLRTLLSQQFFPWCEENDRVHYYDLQESGLKILIVPYYSKMRQSTGFLWQILLYFGTNKLRICYQICYHTVWSILYVTCNTLFYTVFMLQIVSDYKFLDRVNLERLYHTRY